VLSTLWSSISGKFADRFASASAPALIFWLGGLLAWSYAHDGMHALVRPASWLGRQGAFIQALVIAVVLVGVTASAVVVNRLTAPALRLLEGYWPSWAGPVQRTLVARQVRRGLAEDDEWQQLMRGIFGDAAGEQIAAGEHAAEREQIAAGEHAAAEKRAALAAEAAVRAQALARFGRLERARDARPSQPDLYMPTRIGNILRAAETRPRDKYGLDSVAVWPRLWLALPDSTRQEITVARAAVDSAVAASIWGILFLIFIPWTVLALPAGLALSAVAVLAWVPARAEVFGQLVVAAFDVHRTALYQQLRWPLPVSPQDERIQGKRLCSYLQKGSDSQEPVFRQPSG
jgi:hypothetical protein